MEGFLGFKYGLGRVLGEVSWGVFVGIVFWELSGGFGVMFDIFFC